MDEPEYEIVKFDPHEKLHAHLLVEPHWRFVLMKVREVAYELGLDADRLARLVRHAIEVEDELPGIVLSTLREVSRHQTPAAALEILERERIGHIHGRAVVLAHLASPRTPLYTRGELAELLKASIEHLKRNQADLILRGHPRTRFSRCPWLHVRLSWLYPVRSPEKATWAENAAGESEYAYGWGEDEKVDVSSDGRIFIRHYEHSYEDAPFHYGLSLVDAGHLEELRPRMFDLKVGILDRLANALRKDDGARVELSCLDLICNAFTYDEVEFLFKQDRELLNFGPRTKEEIGDPHGGGMPRSVTGGLSNLLELIGHCEIEIQQGTYHDTTTELVACARGAGMDPLANLLAPSGYWAALGKEWRPQLDEILNRHWERNSQRSHFWPGFLARVDGILEKQLRRTVSPEFKVKREHLSRFEPYLRSLGEYVLTTLDVGGAISDDLLPRSPAAARSKKGMASFPTPPRATWGDVAIRFRDEHTVSVDVRGVKGVLNYSQMGMANRRSTNPTKQWNLLRDFAAGHGLLAWGMRGAGREKQKRRERLARDLQSFFRIAGDPFRLLEDKKGWQTRFRLEPQA